MRFQRIVKKAAPQVRPTLESTMTHFGIDFNPERNAGMARCPLHEDRTPSLSYRLDNGLWRCHSCGNGGDAFTMILKYRELVDDKPMTFRQAVQYAKDHGLEEGAEPEADEYVSRYGGRRSPSGKKPSSGGGYVPAWKRGDK